MYSWRSQEQYWSFKRKMGKDTDAEGEWEEEEIADPQSEDSGFGTDEEIDVNKIYAALDQRHSQKQPEKIITKIVPGGKRIRRKQYSGQVPRGLPDKFYDENGEINLTKVTGAEAHRYFQSLGMPLPMIRKFE